MKIYYYVTLKNGSKTLRRHIGTIAEASKAICAELGSYKIKSVACKQLGGRWANVSHYFTKG